MALASVPLRGMTRVQYDHLVSGGFFEPDARLELIYGMLVAVNPQGARHGAVLRKLTMILTPQLVGRAEVSVQLPWAASDESEPEPDVSVVPPGNYVDDHPTRAHLVVEVGVSSLAYDRSVKVPLYAESDVPEVWVVDVERQAVTVYRAPRDGAYQDIVEHDRTATLALRDFSDVKVRLADVFPEA